jgi:hypothetical protein
MLVKLTVITALIAITVAQWRAQSANPRFNVESESNRPFKNVRPNEQQDQVVFSPDSSFSESNERPAGQRDKQDRFKNEQLPLARDQDRTRNERPVIEQNQQESGFITERPSLGDQDHLKNDRTSPEEREQNRFPNSSRPHPQPNFDRTGPPQQPIYSNLKFATNMYKVYKMGLFFGVINC